MRLTAAFAAIALLVAGVAHAQFFRGGDASIEAHIARPESFDEFSVEGYRVAVNVLLYAMTH